MTEFNPFTDVPCGKCGVPALRLEFRLETLPLGSWSLAGTSLKVSARKRPWAVCDACGAECKSVCER